METDKQIELVETREIELPSLDITKYIGMKSKIASVKEYEGQFGYYIKIESEVLETIEGKKEPIDIKASNVFGLHEDRDGNIGWGKESKLGVYLKKMGVEHYKDLVGKEIIVQSRTSKRDQKDYLTFN